MKPTPQTQKAALSELFKGINLAKKSTTPSTTEKWAGFAARFTAPFSESEMPPPPLTREESNLAGQLNKYLKSELEKNSSVSPVTDHFLDLFTGLNIISTTKPNEKSSMLGLTEKQKIAFLSKCDDSAALTHALDELYYHSRLSRVLASTILKNPAYTEVDHMYQLIFGRGNLLGWTVASCYTFKLQVANKCWVMGERDKARAQVVDGFASTWVPVVESGLLSNGVLMGLVKAVLLFKRADLLSAMVGRWSAAGQEQVVARVLPIWVECHKQREFAVCDELISAGLALTSDPLYRLVFTCLADYPQALSASLYKSLSGDVHQARGALLVELAALACTSHRTSMYESLRQYIDELISHKGQFGHAETLSTALALQKLQSFHSGSSSSSGSGSGSGSGTPVSAQKTEAAGQSESKSVLT